MLEIRCPTRRTQKTKKPTYPKDIQRMNRKYLFSEQNWEDTLEGIRSQDSKIRNEFFLYRG